MSRKYFKSLIVIGFILVFQIPFFSSADEAIPPDILNAAREGIDIFLKDAQIRTLYELGFSGKEEADNAAVGNGFEVFTVTPDSLLNAGASRICRPWPFLLISGNS